MRLTVCLILLLSQLLCRMEDEQKGDPPSKTGLSDSQPRKGSSEIKDQEQSRKDDGRGHRRKPSKNEPFPGIPLKLEEEPQQQPPQKSQIKKHKISTESVPCPEDDVVVGYLKKQGPPHRPTWKKRWVVVSKDRRLTYYKSKAQSVKKREKLLIGTVKLNRSTVLVLNASTKKKFEMSFGIKTPDRNFVFLPSDEADKERWTPAILKIMSEIRDEIKADQAKLEATKESIKAKMALKASKGNSQITRTNGILPSALLVEIFLLCKVKDITTTCSLICKEWYASAQSDPLWEQLSRAAFASVFSKGEEKAILAKAGKLSAKYLKMNSWKRFYCWMTLSRNLLSWDPKYHPEVMLVSADQKTVTHATDKSTHRDCYSTTSFTTGVHSWQVRVDGLVEGYWAALGVCDLPSNNWAHGTRNHWGLSSEGVVQNGPEQPNLPRWKNGDELTMTLDTENKTFEIKHNGKSAVTLNVPRGELWPWVNIFQAGTSVTLVPQDK